MVVFYSVLGFFCSLLGIVVGWFGGAIIGWLYASGNGGDPSRLMLIMSWSIQAGVSGLAGAFALQYANEKWLKNLAKEDAIKGAITTIISIILLFAIFSAFNNSEVDLLQKIGGFLQPLIFLLLYWKGEDWIS